MVKEQVTRPSLGPIISWLPRRDPGRLGTYIVLVHVGGDHSSETLLEEGAGADAKAESPRTLDPGGLLAEAEREFTGRWVMIDGPELGPLRTVFTETVSICRSWPPSANLSPS